MSLFEQAKKVIPGGVNSPVRAFGSVGGEPYFVEKGYGSKVLDSNGKEYIDYVCSWGPLILGHCDKDVNNAIVDAVQNGASYGAPTRKEVEMAELISKMIPSIEMVRMVSSGTEAIMSAIRLARGFTKRDKIVKFEGCYHGHSDALLVKAGSGLLTFGTPSSPGVPADVTKHTLVAQYNDISTIEQLFKENPGEIACVIVEPAAANMGLVLPEGEFLQKLQAVCKREGALLIFDEVITGFRLSASGAQGYYGIQPDLTTLGKIIGGGLPVGAYGGRREIMEMISPAGPVYQAGTLSGNPLAMSAGLATLKKLNEKDFYAKLKAKADVLWAGMAENQTKLGLNYAFNQIESLGCTFFTNQKVTNYQSAISADTKKYAQFFHGMLKRGVAIAPAQFEVMFVSSAHTDADIEHTLKAHYEALKELN
ncbi:MAG: glutamate-1-semialdehyde 2,1-aminomutase [Deferribacteraceae bacterium]|jgi:glutamate-1-semialdehyde 2,1-aminomutase|nr:glutamate-1-semialdehyde 2,1-aminomutase [Deferribacteraceae bacterium]